MPVKTNNTDYQKLDILFKYSRESVLIFNDDIKNLKILAFNKKAYQQLGYTREEFKKISLKDIEAVESQKETLEHLKKIYTEGNAIFETRHKKKNGELIDILVIAQAFVLDNKKVFQVIFKDITKQKQAEKELKQQEKKYRDLFETASDMIHVVDSKGIILDANELELKTLGYTKKEYIGKKNFDIITKYYKEDTSKQIKQVLSGTCVKQIRTQFIKKDGGVIDVEINACPTIENGKVTGATAFIRDISQRLKYQKQLEEKIQELEKLNRLMIGRELQMVGLKKEIKKLSKK